MLNIIVPTIYWFMKIFFHPSILLTNLTIPPSLCGVTDIPVLRTPWQGGAAVVGWLQYPGIYLCVSRAPATASCVSAGHRTSRLPQAVQSSPPCSWPLHRGSSEFQWDTVAAFASLPGTRNIWDLPWRININISNCRFQLFNIPDHPFVFFFYNK